MPSAPSPLEPRVEVSVQITQNGKPVTDREQNLNTFAGVTAVPRPRARPLLPALHDVWRCHISTALHLDGGGVTRPAAAGTSKGALRAARPLGHVSAAADTSCSPATDVSSASVSTDHLSTATGPGVVTVRAHLDAVTASAGLRGLAGH